MRERLKAGALPAVLAWIIAGAAEWRAMGTAPPQCVREITDDYIDQQDTLGAWIDERCERAADASERSSDLHRDYAVWCEGQGLRPKSNKSLSEDLRAAGFDKRATELGKVFYGLRLKPAPTATHPAAAAATEAGMPAAEARDRQDLPV